MAHYAKLNLQNVVEQVIVISNQDEMRDGVESEEQGIAFCKSLFGPDTKWIKTSYNRKIRKRYAGIGYAYNSEKDIFIPPKPYISWSLNSDDDWSAPVPYPEDGKVYRWDENTLNWVQIEDALPMEMQSVLPS